MPCDPKDLASLANLLAEGKHGEVEVQSLMEEPKPASPSVVQNRSRTSFLNPLRTQMAAWSDEFAVKVIQPIARQDILRNNFVNKANKEFLDAIQPAVGPRWKRWLGVSQQTDEQLNKALGMIDASGRFTGPEGSFPPEIIQSAQNIRQLYNKYGIHYGIEPDTYLNLYRELMINRPQGTIRNPAGTPLEEQFFSRLKPEEKPFYDELERKGTIVNPNKTASAAYAHFINAIGNANIIKPFIENIEREAVHPYFDMKLVQDSAGHKSVVPNDLRGWQDWEDYKHHMFGGPTQIDMIATDQMNKLTQMFGYKAETRDLYQVSQGMTSAFYSGVLGSPLGGRPSSTIRHLFKIVPSTSLLGAKAIASALEKVFKPGAIKALEERGFISSPMEQIIQASNMARSAGRVISGVTDASLKVFTAGDKLVRGLTAYGSEAKFNDYHQRGILNRLPGLKEIRDEVTKLIAQGQVEKARDAYIMNNLTNLEYIYGKANRPKIFRGALGNLAGTLMAYPLNWAEMIRIFGKEFGEGAKGALKGDMEEASHMVPLMRLLTTWFAMGYAGSQFFNVDMRSVFLHGALPSTMAFPKMGLDTYQAFRTNVEWLTGDMFGVGSSDYHEKQRKEATANFAKDMRSFVPGGVFFFEDIPRAIDEGSLVRMLALTPKAEDINRMAQEKAKRVRQESRAPIRAIGPIER